MRGRSSTWVRLPGGPRTVDAWTRRGREYARRLLGEEGLSAAEVIDVIRDRGGELDLDRVLVELERPAVAARLRAKRDAFVSGVISEAIRAGGLRLGRPSRSDLDAPDELVADAVVRS